MQAYTVVYALVSIGAHCGVRISVHWCTLWCTHWCTLVYHNSLRENQEICFKERQTDRHRADRQDRLYYLITLPIEVVNSSVCIGVRIDE